MDITPQNLDNIIKLILYLTVAKSEDYKKSIPAELKAKVAMEAIKGQKTINERAVALFSKTREKSVKESDT